MGRAKRKRNQEISASPDSGEIQGEQMISRESEDKRKEYQLIELKSELMEQFYRRQQICTDENDFQAFLSVLRSDLPSSFRITGNRSRAFRIRDSIEKQFIPNGSIQLPIVEDDAVAAAAKDISDAVVEQPKPIPFYPDQLAWQYSIPRRLLRKMPSMQRFHQFLVNETEVGNISRQETVSMIPPLLLNVLPGHAVLDMCAAPGSKTGQIVERLMMMTTTAETNPKDPHSIPTGLVIANDTDNKRCYTLVHQLKRLQSPCVMVTNHDATLFPTIYCTRPSDKREAVLKFDRILCDVPCSGDGTLRKNPLIWRNWNPNNALGLHPIQIKILTRALQMIKVGGRIVYSTCSFNPIENEAVLAAVLEAYPGVVELEDVGGELPELQREPGFLSWTPMTKQGEFYARHEDLPENLKRGWPPSLFPPASVEAARELGLERCMRILPHRQNTGGFFIAVLRKIGPMDRHDSEAPPVTVAAEESNTAADETNDIKEIHQGFKEAPFIFINDQSPVRAQVCKNFGLKDFPVDQFLVRSESANSSIYFVSRGAKQVLCSPSNAKLKVINCGIKAFEQNKLNVEPEDEADGKVFTSHRIHQEILGLVHPFVSEDKVIDITEQDLRVCLEQEFPFFNQFSAVACERLKSSKYGGLIFRYQPLPDRNFVADEPVVLSIWRAKTSVNLLLNKKERESLRCRLFGYNDPEGTTPAGN